MTREVNQISSISIQKTVLRTIYRALLRRGVVLQKEYDRGVGIISSWRETTYFFKSPPEISTKMRVKPLIQHFFRKDFSSARLARPVDPQKLVDVALRALRTTNQRISALSQMVYNFSDRGIIKLMTICVESVSVLLFSNGGWFENAIKSKVGLQRDEILEEIRRSASKYVVLQHSNAHSKRVSKGISVSTRIIGSWWCSCRFAVLLLRS
jgi:hypothetical protein